MNKLINKFHCLGGLPAPKSICGFTLIELAIVVTIMGILGTIALASYRDYVEEGCRTDAKSALETVVNKQEHFYFDFNQYAGSITSLPIQATDPEGHYTLSTTWILGDSNSFSAVAVQSAGQDCLPDNDIQYRINHTGFRQHKVFGGTWDSYWE